MRDLLELVRTRLLPAILTAAGVALVTAGLLSYTVPVEARPADTPDPTPTEVAIVSPSPSEVSASTAASPSGRPSPSGTAKRVATRVEVPALGIDLPVVKPPGGSGAYPLCNVAM